jgi:hypothetical protein
MTIFLAVMSINDRPSCISYTGAALLGAGRRPWGISHLPGHFKKGGGFARYTAAPPTTRTDKGALVHSPLRLAPQEGSLLIGGRDMQRKSGQQRGGTIASTCRHAWRI